MKRPWRLVIEVGQQTDAPGDNPPAQQSTGNTEPSPGVRQEVWSTLVEARRKMLESVAAEEPDKAEAAANWIGGALAIWGKITHQDPPALLERLTQEVPPLEVESPYKDMEFKHIEPKRPPRHPGAQRKVDISELTPEEREELGVTLPEPPVDEV